jgi:BTB/POZ domain
MANIVHFNVGGMQYNVPRSLLEMHPNTMLARSASEQWLPNPDAEVFVERDGIRFALVLDYLRDDGHVILPMTIPKPSFVADLVYYGVENIDESKIIYKYCADTEYLAHAVYEIHTEIHPHFSADISVDITAEVKAEIKAEIKVLESRCGIFTLAEECANSFLSSGGKLKINIHGPNTNLSKPQNTLLCSYETWMDLLLLFCNDERRILPEAQLECNTLLARVGLEIVSVVELSDKCIIQVVLKLTDI